MTGQNAKPSACTGSPGSDPLLPLPGGWDHPDLLQRSQHIVALDVSKPADLCLEPLSRRQLFNQGLQP